MKKTMWVLGLGFLAAASASKSVLADDVVDCEITAAQFGFASYMPPQVGDTIRLNLTQGPASGMLRFKSDRTVGWTYIPAIGPWRSESGDGQIAWVSGTSDGALKILTHSSALAHEHLTITKTIAAGGGLSEEAHLDLFCAPAE